MTRENGRGILTKKWIKQKAMNGKSTCFFLHRDKMAGENLGRKNGAPAAKKFAESSPGALNPKGNVSSVGFNGTSTVIRKSVSADRACTGRVPEREFRWYRGHFRPKQKKFCLGLFCFVVLLRRIQGGFAG